MLESWPESEALEQAVRQVWVPWRMELYFWGIFMRMRAGRHECASQWIFCLSLCSVRNVCRSFV